MFKNIIWDFIGKFSVQIVGFGISIILTRLLSPSQFGVMGMAMVIIIFAHIFLDLGFNRAIIQQQEITQVQYSTIFYLNTFVAILLTAICYFLAGPLSVFYHQPLIAPVFRVLSVSFLINGLNLVPAALLYKRLQLKLNSILTLIASLISGIAGVFLAYNGYGVWSLVVQSLINSFLILVLSFIYAKWLPVLQFSIASIKPLWQYGSKMFASGLLDNLYTRMDVFIIGKLFTTSILGFYTRAQSMDNFVRQISVNSIMGALFPYIARHQNNRAYLKDIYVKYLNVITFIAIALSGTLFLIARPLFLLLFTPKWLYAADLFRLMSIIGFVWPVCSMMCNIIAGVGNSTAFLRLEVIKKAMFLPVYLFGFLFGLQGFLYIFIAVNFMAVVVNANFVSREIETTLTAQLKIIMAYFFAGALAVAISYVFFTSFFSLDHISTIIFLSILFNCIYLATCFAFNLPVFKSITGFYKKLNQFFHDKRNKNLFTAI